MRYGIKLTIQLTHRHGLWIDHSALHTILVHQTLNTHTHTEPFNDPLSGTTWVGWYQKKTFTHSHPS